MLSFSSCSLRGGIENTKVFCRSYSFVKITTIDSDPERDENYSSLIKNDRNYTYMIFNKDGRFNQRTVGFYANHVNDSLEYDLIETGSYYQKDYDIYLFYDNGKNIIATDRPGGVSDVTNIKVPFSLPLDKEKTVETFIYYYNGIYNSRCQ